MIWTVLCTENSRIWVYFRMQLYDKLILGSPYYILHYVWSIKILCIYEHRYSFISKYITPSNTKWCKVIFSLFVKWKQLCLSTQCNYNLPTLIYAVLWGVINNCNVHHFPVRKCQNCVSVSSWMNKWHHFAFQRLYKRGFEVSLWRSYGLWCCVLC
jgi:hypothetical protein